MSRPRRGQHETLRNVKSAWVKDQRVSIGDDGTVDSYQVNLEVTFELEG